MAAASDDHVMEVETEPTGAKAKQVAAEAFYLFGLAKRSVEVGDCLFVGEPRSSISTAKVRGVEKALEQPLGSARREMVSRRSDDRKYRIVLKVAALSASVLRATETFTVSVKVKTTVSNELVEIRGSQFAKPLPCQFEVDVSVSAEMAREAMESSGLRAQRIHRPTERLLLVQFFQQRQLDFFLDLYQDPRIRPYNLLVYSLEQPNPSPTSATNWFVFSPNPL